MHQHEFTQALANLNIAFTAFQFNQLDRYFELLTEWNQRMNLTAITQKEEVLEKHFLDCLLLVPALRNVTSLADVGSGAGFPAIPLAIALPELKITMIEPIGKRTLFLNEVVKQLGLTNAKVVNQRSEEYVNQGHRFDVVTARAVAALPILLELCTPLAKVNGQVIAMKGSSGLEELEAAKHAMEVLKLTVENIRKESLPTAGLRYNLILRKNGETPKGYPRNFAQIKKKPL